jgi:hypothetical protein
MRSSQPTKPKLSPLRPADHARLAVRSASTSSLRTGPSKSIDADRSATSATGMERRSLEQPHDPAAERVAQTGMQIEAAHVRRIVQRRQAAKLEAGIAAAAAVRAREQAR